MLVVLLQDLKSQAKNIKFKKGHWYNLFYVIDL